MTGEPITEREAILAARVKELEAAAQAQVVSVAKGGVFEATWRTINTIIPTWLAVVALAVFLAHQAFGYYVKAQIIEAETQLKAAKADVEKAQADALNAKIGDEPMRLATLKAELLNKQAEAARARAEARAQSAEVNGETTRLATLKAQLANVENQARLARAKADAESAKFGLQTLEQRAVRAKLILQQLKIIDNRAAATQSRIANLAGQPNSLPMMFAAMARAFCEDNQFAELIDCPAKYIRRNSPSNPAPAPAPPPAPAAVPQATAQGMRTPTAFDCSKATLGVDYVICANPQLLDLEARLEDAYRAAHAVGGDNVKMTQRAWAKSYGPGCGLPAKGQPSSAEIRSSRDCVARAMNQRIGALQAAAQN